MTQVKKISINTYRRGLKRLLEFIPRNTNMMPLLDRLTIFIKSDNNEMPFSVRMGYVYTPRIRVKGVYQRLRAKDKIQSLMPAFHGYRIDINKVADIVTVMVKLQQRLEQDDGSF